MGYSAGNLELSILGFSEKAVASIDVTAKALRRLASAVDKINNTQFVFAGRKLEVLFTKIAKATNSINTTNITKLASAAKSLSSISKLSNLDKMDFDKVGKGFETLSTAIQPFLNKVKEAEASLTALDGILRHSSGKKIQGLLGGGDSKGNRSSNGMFSFAKRFASIYMLRRMGRFMGDLVQAGSDYYETLNLWQVAMRGNLDTADQFINKMNKAYGISTKTLMNAQAIFKNMIGSLGQISDATAYALSEALVQMSADFSSIYNVQLEKAFEKMQAMLAGQVRPIRSAGLDMTETTLFMFYQQLGGTKTMRQLNRTEKQLLSILAVYIQMGSAGALGDMTKTLNSFANQSRMMVEYWRELKAWSGLLIKDLLEEWQVLKYINATLITMTEIVKAIARSRGLGEENFIDGMFESVEATNDAVDELQGKLLDFDNFRSLEGTTASPLAIDEKLLQAITEYSSKIEDAENEAQLLADTWLEFWLTDEGTLTKNAESFLSTLKETATIISILIGLKVANWIGSFVTGLFSIGNASKIVNGLLLGGAVYAIIKAIESFKDGDYWAGILATTLAVVLGGAFIYLHRTGIAGVITGLGKFIATGLIANTLNFKLAGGIAATTAGFLAMGAAIGLAFWVFSNWETMNGIQKTISIIGVLTVALLGAAIAFGAFHSAWSLGLAIGGIAVGIAAVVASVKSAQKDIENINPTTDLGIDKNVLNTASSIGSYSSEYNPTNYPTNQSAQRSEASYERALNSWWQKAKHDIPALEGVSESGLYTMVDGEARRRGKKFVNV